MMIVLFVDIIQGTGLGTVAQALGWTQFVIAFAAITCFAYAIKIESHRN